MNNFSKNNLEHTCYIGSHEDYFDSELVTVDELKTKCSEDSYNRYSLSDYLDKRKSVNFTRFDYCPVCGKPIDYQKLKKTYS